MARLPKEYGQPVKAKNVYAPNTVKIVLLRSGCEFLMRVQETGNSPALTTRIPKRAGSVRRIPLVVVATAKMRESPPAIFSLCAGR